MIHYNGQHAKLCMAIVFFRILPILIILNILNKQIDVREVLIIQILFERNTKGRHPNS